MSVRGNAHALGANALVAFPSSRYEVITTPTDIIMVIEYAGGELFNYIVEVRLSVL